MKEKNGFKYRCNLSKVFEVGVELLSKEYKYIIYIYIFI